MTIYDNIFVTFYTLGAKDLGEPGMLHGRLIDLYKPEEDAIGYKIKIIRSKWDYLKARIFPHYDPYIILPVIENALFTPSLFNISIEELKYRASIGVGNISLFYSGSYNTGEPLQSEDNKLLLVDRIIAERDTYKVALAENVKILIDFQKNGRKQDEDAIKYTMSLLHQLKIAEQAPLGRPAKMGESTANMLNENINMDEATRGKGLFTKIREML